ncbi:MAG: hypothetical protein NTX27_09510 [Verrucomicrobia bacterium]|nr:hypothetical protein [Verrucomicrobiota bacterium]
MNIYKDGESRTPGQVSIAMDFWCWKSLAVITLTMVFMVAESAITATGATLQVSGVVPSVKEITIDPAPGYGSLDLATSAVDVLVLTARERANSAGGYTVTVESANAVTGGRNTASLNNVSAGTDKLDYTLKYGGEAVALGNSGVAGRARVTDLNVKTPVSGSAKALQISYEGNHQLASGIYQDTLTFTISAK